MSERERGERGVRGEIERGRETGEREGWEEGGRRGNSGHLAWK